MDAVVTDSKGRHIRDLQAGDFELYQDGRKQIIRSCVYVDTGAPGHTGPNDFGRRIVVLLDDLNVSVESMAALHAGLLTFVQEQLEPGDSAALAVASRSAVVQGFTSDKDQLLAAIRRLPWKLGGRTDPSAVESLALDQLATAFPEAVAPEKGDRARTVALNGFEGLSSLLTRLAAMPGRKGLVILSDGNPVVGSAAGFANVANRGSVVVYHIDPRGVIYAGFNASDFDTLFGVRIPPSILLRMASERSYDIALSQLGAGQLSKLTGGFVIQNSNDFTGALHCVMEDLRGYYLLSYSPDPGSLDAKGGSPYHSIAVKVGEPGLRVRSRTGFFVPEQAGLHLKLTPLIWRSGDQPPVPRATLHIDVNGLSFSPGLEGVRQDALQLELEMATPAGEILSRVDRALTIRAQAAELEALRIYGFVSTLDLPLEAPGDYWVSARVRELESGKTGMAGQPVTLPAAGTLGLSSIQLMTDDAGAAPFATVSSTALRRFHRGQAASWSFQVSHPAPGMHAVVSVKSPDRVVTSRTVAVGDGGTPFVTLRGRIRLAGDLEPGEYTVMVELSGVRQSIDFVLVE